jgi:hypothetical protein
MVLLFDVSLIWYLESVYNSLKSIICSGYYRVLWIILGSRKICLEELFMYGYEPILTVIIIYLHTWIGNIP